MKRGLFGGALLAVGGAGFLATRAGPVPALPKDGLLVLSPREYGVVQAVAGRLIPSRPGEPTVEGLHVGRQVDRILSRVDRGAQAEVKQLLGLFDNALANLVLHGHARPFAALPVERQDEVLARWQESRLAVLRTGFVALRTLVMSAFYSQRESWASVGYPGPPEGFHQPHAPVWRGVGPRL